MLLLGVSSLSQSITFTDTFFFLLLWYSLNLSYGVFLFSVHGHFGHGEYFSTFLFTHFFAEALYLLEDSVCSSIFSFFENLFVLSYPMSPIVPALAAILRVFSP